MTNQQIKMLIRHNEIKQVESIDIKLSELEINDIIKSLERSRFGERYFDKPNLQYHSYTNYRFYNNKTQTTYILSNTVFKLLENLFNFFLEETKNCELGQLRNSIQKGERLYAPGKHLKRLLYEKLILYYNEKIETCYHWKISGYSVQEIKNKWADYLIFVPYLEKKHFEFLLENIKFLVLSKNKIEDASFHDLIKSDRLEWIRGYFVRNKKIAEIYKLLAYEECIKELQKLIYELELSEKNISEHIDSIITKSSLTKREIAFIGIFKKINLVEISACREILSKYNEHISPIQAKEVKTNFLTYNNNGTISLGETRSVKERNRLKKNIQNIMEYLNFSEKKEALNCLTRLDTYISY